MTQHPKTLPNRQWRGYTLAELREQQAVNDACIMVQKFIIAGQCDDLRNYRMRTRNIFHKMINTLSYVDFALLGLTLSRRLLSIIAKMRRHFGQKNRLKK